jgi:hypothetical protein
MKAVTDRKEARLKQTLLVPMTAAFIGNWRESFCACSKRIYPNLRQVFLTAGAYAGYFTKSCVVGQFSCPDDEPFIYEIAFAKKDLIQNQLTQLRSGVIDPVAGDLAYNKTAWIAWRPYLWAPACSLGIRADGLCYSRSDFAGDGLHPSVSGVQKIVQQQILPFFLSDPHTASWFAHQ